ncbi:Piso0_003331 [Millerozyma farinosa CBS 7064]|uniref:Mitochondrial escape protein 2 n=1 Tax=Pichia sorbitophila (strain ATCC MYA-4447 / BCRC 22081 / CBS 7064 / NBRC 10061 / NRRL Y-12695) TaxID=559304 RepID=G8YHU2_PICSO|nr:Piso0_003331 [Millerozyma farinosa CBS 7064]CCE80994.1 Piso0_003331 [Millerozyma farinosa CBS 7064]
MLRSCYRRNIFCQLRKPLGYRPILAPRSTIRTYSSDVENLKKETEDVDLSKSVEYTGVIDYEKEQNVLLYFDHIYPIMSRWGKILQHVPILNNYYNDERVKNHITNLIQSEANPLPENVSMKNFVALKRDGGAFVTFSIPADHAVQDVSNKMISNANEKVLTSGLDFIRNLYTSVTHQTITCFQVKGTPWIEDLRRHPSPRLKVIFEGDSLTEEELYVLFRRYGVIVDIIPANSSTPYATVIFKRVRSAACAKNCMTGIELPKHGTTLHLRYIPLERVNVVKDLIVNHQRISIPIILALLATVAVLIFDPIREKFIEAKVTHKYSLDTYKDNKYFKYIYTPYKTLVFWIRNGYRYLDENLISTTHTGRDKPPTDYDNAIWYERSEKVKQLRLWIYENINTFIIVRGPKGSGKQEFVLDHCLKNDERLKNKILYIDCDALAKSRNDASLITSTAQQVGYFPVFTWLNSISQFIDLGVQGLTGQKSGLSESMETQLKNILSLTSQALRGIALNEYRTYRSSALQRKKLPSRSDVDVTAEPEVLKEDEYLQQHPEGKPVLVINNYAMKSDKGHDVIYPLIADWAAQLIQNNIAHVIFITDDVGSLSQLSKALPNQVFKGITLSDASTESAKHYVLNQLSDVAGNEGTSIDSCLGPLGGRMLDLQAFVRRIRSGETPKNALEEMIHQASEQITTFFLNDTVASQPDREWKTTQVWTIIKLLSDNDSVSYSELAKIPLFASYTDTLSTLSALEKYDLVTLNRNKGVLESISIGRPLFRAAFKDIVQDVQLYKNYETAYYKGLIETENAKITKLEDEVAKISKLSDLKYLKSRLEYIQSKIEASTNTILDYEAQLKDVGKVDKPKKSILGIQIS